MKTIAFSFLLHNHQPIGNFDSVIEEAYQNSYKPFLEVLKKHPDVKFTQHWTGTLLEWLNKNHPEFIREMRKLIRRKQLELLTGSYYEAILPIIPEADRVGQIRKLTDTILRMFDYVPRGMWIAERVWEQQLVGSLAKAGVEFVVVDDTHFRHAGLGDDQLLGYYVTEDEGISLKIMPIDKVLRYTIPFRKLDETKHYLQGVASEHGDRVVVHGDDGEKFGVWPKTFKSVYEDKWLDEFCTFLEENRAWVRTKHLGTIMDTLPPLGRIYLPTASYSEMMKWALPPTAFIQLQRFEKQLKEADLLDDNSMFIRGGYWRNFLSKYPEANHLHKKMLRVAKRARSNGRVPQEILDHLWAGQCNDPYWHGVFGGLYLPNLRFPVYRHLLKAEAGLDRLEKRTGVHVDVADFDCDGKDEILLESNILNLYFKPGEGGSLVELDHKPVAVNLLDIISRREEGYHRRFIATQVERPDDEKAAQEMMVKELGLEKHLNFDWYRHASLVDHFFGNETTIESYQQCKYLETGDFVNQPYKGIVRKGKPESVEVILSRDGAIWSNGSSHKLSVKKRIRYRAGDSHYTVDYELQNGEKTPIELWFGVEFNIGLLAGDAHDRYYEIEGRTLADARLRSIGEELDIQSFKLVDEWLGIETCFTSDRPATLWRFPIETVSLSEAGLERLYQSSMVTLHWKTNLTDSFRASIEQTVRELARKRLPQTKRRKKRSGS